VSRYHLDPAECDLDWLRGKLETHEIVPARRMLQDRVPERFEALRAAGIETMKDLVDALRSRDRIAKLSKRTGLPIEYLVWLGREARSYKPNPFSLRSISEVDIEVIDRLEHAGIQTTKRLFDLAAAASDRRRLAHSTGIDSDALLALVKLSDLARIRGLGPTFVRLFTECGVDRIDVLKNRNPEELHGRLCSVRRERRRSSIVPSLKDVTEYVEMAAELPSALEI